MTNRSAAQPKAKKPHLYRLTIKDPIKPVMIMSSSMKMVAKILESDMPVPRRRVRSNRGVVMNQSQYLAYHIARVVPPEAPLRYSRATGVLPKLEAIAKYATEAVDRIATPHQWKAR